jgi:hypothetical protein
MWKRLVLLPLLILAACQQNVPNSGTPTAAPFPTMTPGRVIEAPLSAALSVPLDGSGLANPATAIARANQPSPTPNTRACPEPDESATLDATAPINAQLMDEAIARYLSDGGSVAELESTLRDDWNVLGDDGVVRGDADLTGEGTNEVIITYTTPDEGGVLLIEGCIDGRYLTRYQAALGGDTPRLINVGDMNFNAIPEVLFTSEDCSAECVFHTQMATWNVQSGRFVNLLGGAITSDEVPTIQDIDSDQVSEVIVRFDNDGDTTTGPLRTGYSAYDWNGNGYVESVTQLNPPRFLIQVVQQADQSFANQNMDEAVALYTLSLNSTSLENWYNNDAEVLRAYILYRLLLAYSYTENDERAAIQQAIQTTYADTAAAPPYAQMALDFWNAYQITNDLHAACLRAQETVTARPDALELLNRYGSRSPTYTAADLCPF